MVNRVNNCILVVSIGAFKLPVRGRFFRVGIYNDPYCEYCDRAEIADVTHVLTSCVRVNREFSWVRGRIIEILNIGGISNFEYSFVVP